MKHLVSLLCLCAALTAGAAVPKFNNANIIKPQKGEKVMMDNSLRNLICQQAMQYQPGNGSGNGDVVMSPRKLMKDLGKKLGDNPLARKAPRNLSDEYLEDLPYIDFRYCYQWTDDGIVEDPYYYRGGQGVYMNIFDDQLYCAGLYWNMITEDTYYLPLNIDYSTGLVELPPIGILDDDTISGTVVNNMRVDTVDFSYLLDLNYLIGETDEPSSIYGNIYPDGTIEFNDTLPYVFAGYRALLTYQRNGNPFTGYTYTLAYADTIYFTEIYYNTQFIVANANHQFGYKGAGSRENTYFADAYMYQYDDSTVVVYNLWGMGYPAREMYLHKDSTMTFPPQYVCNYNDGSFFANANFELDQNNNFMFDDEGYVTGFLGYGNEGNVTPDFITWPSTVLLSEDGYLFYPFLHNVLSFIDGTTFIIPTDEPAIMLGDVNNDDVIDIYDIISLIDHLTSEDLDESDSFNPDAADCNEDGSIDETDIDELYNLILSGSWPE